MKATFISKEKNDTTFTMEFTGEELEQATIKAYQASKDKFEIDGFRKGKAPRSIIEKKYGEDIFAEEAINTMVNDAYPTALDELELDVIDSPRVVFSKYEKGQPFTATVTVAVYPDVEVKDYKGVEIEKIEPELSDEDVEKELATMQKRNARMVAVDRPVADGDTALIDYKGFVGDHQFDGGTAEGHPLKIGSGSFIPGFEDQLIGATVGSDVDVKVTFPEEYHSEELSGKEAVFKCHVNEIKEEQLPELDDEFAKDVSEFDTLEELKADMAKKIEEGKKAQAEGQMRDKILEKVYEGNDIEIPQVMVDDEINNMIREFDQQLRSQGMDISKYLEYVGKEIIDFRNDVKDDAFKRVKTRMLVSAVANQEDIQVSDDEVNKDIEAMAAQYNMEVEKIKELIGPENLGFMKQDIKMRKAIELMYDNAVVK